MSELALKLIAENKRTKNPVLDLGNCGLTKFPIEVLECTHLEELNFKTNYWDGELNQLISSLNAGEPNSIRVIPDLKLLSNLRSLRIGGIWDQKQSQFKLDSIWALENLEFIKNNPQLQILNLTGCAVSDLAPLMSLTRLTIIDFSHNKVSDLTPLKKLQQLTSLDFSYNQVSRLAPLQQLQQLTSLDFSTNKVSDLAPLKGLQQLTSLDFSYNQVSDLALLQQFQQLTELDFSSNKVSDLAPVQKLQQLTSLDFSDNQVADLAPLQKLQQLTSLDFSNNQVSDLVPLQKLQQLTSLDFSYNQVSDLAPLQKLQQLTSLDFSYNQVSDLAPLQKLQQLKSLDFSYNQVSDLAPLQKLQQLTSLDFSSNQVSDLAPLQKLQQLTSLYFSYNQVSDLAPLQKLQQLTSLYFSSNQVSDLGPVHQLTKLNDLDFSYNKVADLGPLQQLMMLNALFFEDNQVADLGPLKRLFKNYKCKINANKNPLVNPPYEIYKAGKKAIIDYFSIKNKIPLDQVKCIFLGNSTTGKTSLIRFLVHNEFSKKEVTTHGIYQRVWKIEDENLPKLKQLHVNIWDFGGQHYYHSMHRLFLTRGAVYVLVCNKKLDVNQPLPTFINHEVNGEIKSEERIVEHFNYEYWLNSILYFDKRVSSNKKSKVFLIENKTIIPRQKSEFLHVSQSWLNQKEISIEPFKQINVEKIYLKLNSSTEFEEKIDQRYLNNYDNFERDLKETLFNQVSDSEVHILFPQIRDYIRFWVNQELVETEEFGLGKLFPDLQIKGLENRQRHLPFISDEAFQQLIRDLTRIEDYDGLSFKSFYDLMIIYLDAMTGCITVFPEIPFQPQQEESAKQDATGMICLQPEWLHQAIFKILDQNVVQEGRSFTLEHIDRHIHGGGIEAQLMVNILKQFDLIFEYNSIVPIEAKGNNKLDQTTKDQTKKTFYISPHTLPLFEPENLFSENRDLELALTFQFPDYFPPDSIARFIAREAELAEIETLKIWKYGMLYFNSFSRMRTLIRAERAKNEIQVYLPSNINEKTKSKFLKRFFDNYFLDICKGNQDVKVKLPDYPACLWGDLENATREVRTDIGTYIEKVAFEFFIPKKGKPTVRVFVSYSHKQRKEAIAFKNLLSQKLKFENIEPILFIDLEIPLGVFWHDYLIDKIDECDLLICLLSQEFFLSDYIQENEYGLVLKRIKQGLETDLVLVHFAWFNQFINLEVMGMQIFPSFATDLGWNKNDQKYFSSVCNKENHYKPNKKQNIFVEKLVDNHLNDTILKIAEKKIRRLNN